MSWMIFKTIKKEEWWEKYSVSEKRNRYGEEVFIKDSDILSRKIQTAYICLLLWSAFEMQ